MEKVFVFTLEEVHLIAEVLMDKLNRPMASEERVKFDELYDTVKTIIDNH